MYVQQPSNKLVIFGLVSASPCAYSNQQTNLSSLAQCQLRHVRAATNRQTCHLWLSVSYVMYVQQPTDKLVIFGSVSATSCTYSNQQTNLSSLARCQLRHVRTATNRQTCHLWLSVSYALYVQQPTDKLVIFGSVSATSCTYSNQQTNVLRLVRTATNRQTCYLWLSVSFAWLQVSAQRSVSVRQSWWVGQSYHSKWSTVNGDVPQAHTAG